MKRIAAIFNPLGLFNPIILRAKLFLHALWEGEFGWDDELDEDMTKQWKDIEDDLSQIHTYRLRRHISYEDTTRYELLCFCDASHSAYSAAVYLKASDGTKCQVRLVFSKTRVSPKKKASIPRLELLAVLIGVRILKWIEHGLSIDIDEKHLWTDSQCVLYWLKSVKPLSVFVENRIKEISEKTNMSYHYINTNENPADLLTRGKTFSEIKLKMK